MAKIKINQGDKGFTTMFNTHFMDKRLSWSAVGMLSNVLSLPDEWEFSVKGFMAMHSDGQRVVTSALYELEWFGYLERIQIRNTKGRVVDYIYEFFNESQLPDKTDPLPAWKDRKQFAIKRIQIIDAETGEIVNTSTSETPCLQNVNTDENEKQKPYLQNVNVENADTVFADTDFVEQLNTNKSITNKLNTNVSNNQSIYQYEPEKTAFDKLIDRWIEANDIESIQEYLKDKLSMEYCIDQLDIVEEDFNNVLAILTDMLTTKEPRTYNRRKYQPWQIRKQVEKLNGDAVKYALDSINATEGPIKNLRKYTEAALFFAPDTFDLALTRDYSIARRSI